jgi:uncharacterized protein YuzE
LNLCEKPARESEEVSPGIFVDYDEEGHIVGIEMQYLSKRTPETDVNRLLFELVPMEG